MATKAELLKALELLPDDAAINIFEYRYNGGGPDEYWTEPVFYVDGALATLIIVPKCDASTTAERKRENSPLYGCVEIGEIEDLTVPGCDKCGGTGEEWLNVCGGDGWTGKPCPYCVKEEAA